MYMGRKANPVANKLLYEAEVKKQQEAHKRRIAAMKPSLDTKPPPEHRHLYRNAKKEQVMEGELLRSGRVAPSRRNHRDNATMIGQFGVEPPAV
jgi:hypothetical protein